MNAQIEDVSSALPDYNPTRHFLDLLAFDDEREEGIEVVFQTFSETPEAIEAKEAFNALREDGGPEVDPLAETIPGDSKAESKMDALYEQGASQFMCINIIKKGMPRTNRNVVRIRAVYADFDKPENAPLAQLAKSPIKPSFVVESSPGKFHAYWLVDASFPVKEFRRVQKLLIKHFDSDQNVCDPARVMRIPSAKYAHRKAGKHFLPRIHKTEDGELYGRGLVGKPVTLKQLLGAFDPKAKKPGKRRGFKLPEYIEEGNPGRNKTLFDYARHLRREGEDPMDITEKLLAANAERCEPSLSASEVRGIADNAVNHVDNREDEYTGGYGEAESPAELPDGMFVLPNDHVTFPEAARHLFLTIAEAENMFLHGNTVSERAPTGLEPLHPVAFQSRVDAYGKRVMHYIKIKGTPVKRLVPTRCSKATADVLLRTKETNLLPPVLVVTAAPIITAEGKTLGKGYHRDCGGVIVEGGTADDVPLDKAVPDLLALFAEFDFVTPSDLSRAVAMVLTPALKTAGLIDDPTPVNFFEADASQAGKGFLLKLLYAIYNEAPYVIAQRRNGVGSLDESFSTALLSGRQFILLDNIRGALDSTALESMVTDPANVSARKPRFAEARVDARRVSIAVTANDMETTRDMANRSCTTRILKKPLAHQFKEFAEGDLLAHVKAAQGRYLGCVHIRSSGRGSNAAGPSPAGQSTICACGRGCWTTSSRKLSGWLR